MKITAVLLASVTLSFFGLVAYTFPHNNLGGVSLYERATNR